MARFRRNTILDSIETLTGGNLPDVETLPQPFQDMLDGIKEADPLEKLRVIHLFTLDYMKYKDEDSDGIDPPASINDIIKVKLGIGDCDDYAIEEATNKLELNNTGQNNEFSVQNPPIQNVAAPM